MNRHNIGHPTTHISKHIKLCCQTKKMAYIFSIQSVSDTEYAISGIKIADTSSDIFLAEFLCSFPLAK